MGDPTMPQVPFGELFDDENVQQHYEGLAATLKAAKKRELGRCIYFFVRVSSTLFSPSSIHQLAN